MKHPLILAIALPALLSVTLPSAAHAGRAEKRDKIQAKRIENGVKSGQLTAREAETLENREEHIDKLQDKAKADGKVTLKEKARIEAAQDRTSQAIFRKKHNGRRN